jgi:hypothetical protein
MDVQIKNYQLKIYALCVNVYRTVREEPYNPNNEGFDNSIPFEYSIPYGIYSEIDIVEKEFNNTCIYDFFGQLEIPDIYFADLILYEITFNPYEEGDYTIIKTKNLLETV